MAREERFEIYASEGVGGGVEDLAGYVEGAEKDGAAGEGGGHGIV